MSLLTRPVDELIRYILKRLHGGLIRNDLDINNFSSHLSGGRFKLSNIELNPQAVNSLLPDSPVHLLSAKLQKITVQTPSITRLLEDAIIVEAEGIEIELCSAATSGFAVSHRADDFAADESEDDSARIFSRAVEQVLTNMKFSLIQTRISLRASPQSSRCIELYLPEISLKDTTFIGSLSKTKELKVKGVMVSIGEDAPPKVLDPLDSAHVCQLTEETTVSIAVSKEITLVDVRVRRILGIISPTQATVLWEVAMALGKSVRVVGEQGEEMEELLQRTYLALDDDVRQKLQQSPKKPKNLTLKLSLTSLDIVLLTEPSHFSSNRCFDYHLRSEPYGFLSASHFVLSAGNVLIEKNPQSGIVRVEDLEVFHHQLVETVGIGGSSLFMSARESYSPEFFRQVSLRDELWRVDPETHHYCSCAILYTDCLKEPIHTYLPEYNIRTSKRALKVKFSQRLLAISLAPIYMNIKEPFIQAVGAYCSLFPKIEKPQNSTETADFSQFRISIREPLLRIVVQKLETQLELCYCQLKNRRPWCAVVDISYLTDSDAEGTAGLTLSSVVSAAAVFLISENDIEKVISVEHIEVEVSRAGDGVDPYYCVTLTEEKGHVRGNKEMYIPGQGTMVVPEYFRASEPYDSQYEKACPQAEEISIDPEEERKSFESSKTRLRVTINSFSFYLDPTSLQKLCDLQQQGTAPDKESTPAGKFAVSLAVDTLKVNVMERRLPHASQVRVSTSPQGPIKSSTVISTLDASAIRSRTLWAAAKSGKMVDRRLSVCELALTSLNFVLLQDYLKQGQTFVRLGVSRIRAAYFRGEEIRKNDIFAYSLHPESLPRTSNTEALTIVTTVNSYSSPIIFVTRIDPTQPLLRSRPESSAPGPKSKEINTTIMLRALVFRIDQMVAIAGKVGQFAKVNMGKSQSLDLMKVRIQAKTVLLDYESATIRSVFEVDDFSFWTALVTNLESKGMHAAVSSAQLYLLDSAKDKRPELVFPLLDPSQKLSDFLQDVLGFTLVLSMDSLEVFFSQVVNPQKSSEGEAVPDESPPLLSCLLGGTHCKPVSDSLFMCDLAEHPLKHDILDVHLNLGCVMISLCRDSVEALTVGMQALNKDLTLIATYLTDDSHDPFDDALAAGGVAVHTCSSKGSKVNLMDLAQSGAWGDPQALEEVDARSSGSDVVEDFEDFEEKAVEDPAPLEGSMETHMYRLPHVIHSHISFPSIVKLETIDSDFHQLKPQHGFPIMRITASLSHISAALYQGSDFDFVAKSDVDAKPGEGFACGDTVVRKRIRNEKRMLSCSLKLRQESTGITFTKFPRKLHYASRVSFTIRDFEVLDQIQLSDVYKLLHLNREFPRGPGSHMLAVDYSSVWPRPDQSEEEELRISVSLLPLKINLDQHAVNFVVDLLEKDKAQVSEHIKSEGVRPPALTSAQNTITRSIHTSRPQPQRPAEGFVQSLRVESVSLTIDYIPRNYLFERANVTSPVNAINLFPIENLVLSLPGAHIKGQKNVMDAVMCVCGLWENHIRSNEIFSILGGIGPLVTVKNVGAALLNLVTSPYSSPNPLNSAKKGLVQLATVLSVESLGLLGAALTTIHSAVGSIGKAAGIESTLISRQQVLRPILKAKYTVSARQLDRKTMERHRDKYKGET